MKFRIPSVGRFIWPALCLFQLSLLVGWYVVRIRTVPPPEVEPGEKHSTSVRTPAELTPEQAEHEFGRTNDLLRQGRYDLALAAIRLIAGSEARGLAPTLQYRRALCLEGLGQWDQALEAYRKVVGLAVTPAGRAAAEVGQARVWLRSGRPADARPLLAQLVLRSGQSGLHDSAPVTEAHYLLALALAQEAAPWGPEDDGPARFSLSDRLLARAAGWEMPLADSTTREAASTPDLLDVKLQGGGPEEALVRLRCRELSAEEVVERIAAQSGLKTAWDPESRRLAKGRKLQLILENWPAGDVLRAMAGTLGLTWQLEDGALTLRAESETPAKGLSAYRVIGAQRALRAALLASPEHALAFAVRLELGNLEVREGRLTEARAWYEQALRAEPHSEQAVEAHCNLGLVLRRTGQGADAVREFYRVIDQSPGHELAALAYLRIGQIHLDEGEPALAVTPLRRALTRGAGGRTQPAAAVALAGAWLLAGNPRAAHAVLVEQRETVNRVPYRSAAAFLDALARFRAAAARASTPEGNDLLSALLALPQQSQLGVAGELLRGQAYQELGLADRMAQVYRAALQRAKGLVADEMSHALAGFLYAQGQRLEALQIYSTLSGVEGSPWAARARFSLAEIALLEAHPRQCVDACRGLLRDRAEVDRTALLALMGRAFEQLGERRQAARCFAGEVPD